MQSRTFLRTAAATAFTVLAFTATVRPQGAAPQPERAGTAAKIEVVLSRWQGEKKVSSLPFALYIVAPAPVPGMAPQDNRRWASQNLRMGVDVPIGTVSRTSGASVTAGTASNSTTTTTAQYKNVGTSIDGRLSQTKDGRFSVAITVEDTSMFSSDGNTTQIRIADPMAFRTFTMNNTLTMRDGQTLPFAMATDKVTGDVLKVDVTLTVLK